MFSQASLQAQLLQASQLGPLWNAMRTAVQGIQWSKPSLSTYPRAAASNNEPKIHKSSPLAVQLTDQLIETLESLGLHNLTPGLSVEEVCPVLQKTAIGSDYPTLQSTVSASTFFENKNGFPESLLLQSTYSETSAPTAFSVTVPALHSQRTLLSSPRSPVLHQLSRGFHTKNLKKESGDGVGMPKSEGVVDKLLRISDKSDKAFKGMHVKDVVKDIKVKDAEKNALHVAAYRGYELSQEKNRKDPEREKAGDKRSWARAILTGILLLYLANVGWQALKGSGGDGMRINLMGKAFEVEPEEVTTCFDDVKGVDEAKQELKDVVEFLKNPEKFSRVGARIPKGVLLVGPPGIGKTLLAKAVAGEADVPFFRASGSEFDELFVGSGARKVRSLFGKAKMKAPCVIFIDEIDSVGGKRSSTAIHPYANQTINQLLTEMDGFSSNAGVIVLGATNRRDHLDAAILRPGRFDVEVRVYPPDFKGRVEILEHYLSKVKVSWDVDIEALAKGTTGCTGADLENLVNQAAIKAAMDNEGAVTMEHIEFAKDKVFMGPAKKSRIQDEETNRCTAYHEAGHTIVAYYTKAATPLHKVTIIPRGMSLGHTSFVPDKDQYGMTKAQLLASMDVAMGGRLGEELVLGGDNVTTGASSDFDNATSIATAMVKQYGMSEKFGVRVVKEEMQDSGLSFLKVGSLGPESSDILDSEITRLIQESVDRARKILKDHSMEHKRLAEALLQYETLDKGEIQTVIKGKKLNRKVKVPTPTSSEGDLNLQPSKPSTENKPDKVPVPL